MESPITKFRLTTVNVDLKLSREVGFFWGLQKCNYVQVKFANNFFLLFKNY